MQLVDVLVALLGGFAGLLWFVYLFDRHNREARAAPGTASATAGTSGDQRRAGTANRVLAPASPQPSEVAQTRGSEVSPVLASAPAPAAAPVVAEVVPNAPSTVVVEAAPAVVEAPPAEAAVESVPESPPVASVTSAPELEPVVSGSPLPDAIPLRILFATQTGTARRTCPRSASWCPLREPRRGEAIHAELAKRRVDQAWVWVATRRSGALFEKG